MATGDRSAHLLATVAEVEAALGEVDLLVEKSAEAATRLAQDPGDTLVVLAGGAILHGFYNELEKVFRRIADLHTFEPTGDDWHARLMDQMFLDIEDVRPAVLPAQLKPALREYRGFRHLFRHLYVFNLDSGQVLRLLRELSPLWRSLRQSLVTFATSLRDLARLLRTE